MRFGIRELTFLFLLLAIPVAAYFFVFEPRNRQVTQAREEIRQKQAKIQQLEVATKNMDDLGRKIDKLTEAIEVCEEKLPAHREVEVMLKEVWQLAATHDLQSKSVRTDKPVALAHYSGLPINVKIVGHFDGFYSFLLKLEQLRRITRMPRMILKKSANEVGEIEANMVLNIFFEQQSDGQPVDTARNRL